MAIKDFGFDDNDKEFNKGDKGWKAEKGNTYLVSFLLWDGLEKGDINLDSPTPRWKGALTNYFEKVGPVQNKGPEYTALAQAVYATEPKKAVPKKRVGTIMVVWPTNKKGELDQEKFKAGECEVVCWVHGDMEKYETLKTMHNELHFGSHDIKIICTDSNFQKMTFSTCGKSYLRSLRDASASNAKVKVIYDNIISQAQNLIPELESKIGRDVSIDDIKRALAGEKNSTSSSSTSSSSNHAVADVDNLLDGLLDE